MSEQNDMDAGSSFSEVQRKERERIGSIRDAVSKVKGEHDRRLEEAQKEYEVDFQIITEAQTYLGLRSQDLQNEINKLLVRQEENKVEIRRNKDDARKLELTMKKRAETIEASRRCELDKLDREMAEALAGIRSSKSQRFTEFLFTEREMITSKEEVISQPTDVPAAFAFIQSDIGTGSRTAARSVERDLQIESKTSSRQTLHTLSSQPASQTSPHHFGVPTEASADHIEFKIVDGYYTSPDCMKGVPATKLVEGDNYWRPSWKSLKDWKLGSDNESHRTCNTATFFDKYSIHPNQLVAKKYYTSIGLCIDRAPEVLRIILQSLENYEVADPVQWLRNQLASLILLHEKKDGRTKSFGLKKSIMDFRDSNSEYQLLCLKYENKIIDRTRHLVNGKGDQLDQEFRERHVVSSNRAEFQASSEPTIQPSKRRCVLKASPSDSDSSEEEPLASQRSIAKRDAFNRLHAVSSRSKTPGQSHGTINKAVLGTSTLSIEDPGAKSISKIHPEESNNTSTNLSRLCLKYNVIFDIRSMKVGLQEWKNPTSAKLEYCVAQRMFIPFDGHPRDSAMNQYRTYTEFQVRPANIITLSVDMAMVKVILASSQNHGNSIVRIEFREADDSWVFAALVWMYNKKVNMTGNILQSLEQKGFVAHNHVTEAFVNSLQ